MGSALSSTRSHYKYTSEGIGVDNNDNRIYFTLSLIIALITGIAYNKVWYENNKKTHIEINLRTSFPRSYHKQSFGQFIFIFLLFFSLTCAKPWNYQRHCWEW